MKYRNATIVLLAALAALTLAACSKSEPVPQPPVKRVDPQFAIELEKTETPDQVYEIWKKVEKNSLEDAAAKERLSVLVIPLIEKANTLTELAGLKVYVRPGTAAIVAYQQREADLSR